VRQYGEQLRDYSAPRKPARNPSEMGEKVRRRGQRGSPRRRGSGSWLLARGKAQTRQKQLAVLGVP
jgi:hypothetical protein